MSETPKIGKVDYMDAEALALLSSVSTIFRPSRLLVEPRHPHVSVRWRHARMHSSKLPNTVIFEGLNNNSVIAGDHTKEGVIAISKRETDARQREHGGIHAVAYALGSTVMVGVMEKKEIFQTSHYEDQYRVGVGIGHSSRIVTAGLWSPDTRQLWVPEAPVENQGIYPAGQLPCGIHRV